MAGRATFIVSAAGNDLVELVARVLGMEGGVGTRYEIDADGNFTGELDGPFMYGKGKLEGMRNFAESHDIDLAASWAYSDSASDLPMLRAVGNAVVVNPDTELAEVACARGLAGHALRKARPPTGDPGCDCDRSTDRRGRRVVRAKARGALARDSGLSPANPKARRAYPPEWRHGCDREGAEAPRHDVGASDQAALHPGGPRGLGP